LDSLRKIDSLAKTAKKLFPYNIIIIVAFFLLPVVASFAQNEDTASAIMIISLLKVNPEISFITAAVFGAKNGFKWTFPLVAGGWFLLTMFLFFFYLPFFLFLFLYMACALAGCWFGSLFKSHIDEMYL